MDDNTLVFIPESAKIKNYDIIIQLTSENMKNKICNIDNILKLE